eukprot:2190311-Rhodomonas_salina.6
MRTQRSGGSKRGHAAFSAVFVFCFRTTLGAVFNGFQRWVAGRAAVELELREHEVRRSCRNICYGSTGQRVAGA